MIVFAFSNNTCTLDLEPHLAFPLDQLTHLTLMAHTAMAKLGYPVSRPLLVHALRHFKVSLLLL